MAVNDGALFPVELAPEELPALWQRQARADLRWILDSPPLFEGIDGLLALSGDLTGSHGPVASLEVSMETPPSRRVGLYFESLLDVWLVRVLRLEMEARHLQILEKGRTIGEIDFCVRDKNGARWRLESTIKFYMHHPSTETLLGSAFVGPDPRDSFERKHHHLMERQLRLSVPGHESADRTLPVTRGILFYHVRDQYHSQRPAGVNSKHLRGLWMRASEWREFRGRELGVDRVVHLPKPFWLSGIFNAGLTSPELTWHDAGNALKAHFERSNAPLMMRFQGAALESSRCIVVHDAWPEVCE